MHMMKAISAAVVLSAAIATPVLAQEVYGPGVGAAPYPYGPGSRVQTYYRSYDRAAPGDYLPSDIDQYRNLQNYGFSGRDPSRVGGESPNLRPSGN
jgi:hypothetical protein